MYLLLELKAANNFTLILLSFLFLSLSEQNINKIRTFISSYFILPSKNILATPDYLCVVLPPPAPLTHSKVNNSIKPRENTNFCRWSIKGYRIKSLHNVILLGKLMYNKIIMSDYLERVLGLGVECLARGGGLKRGNWGK